MIGLRIQQWGTDPSIDDIPEPRPSSDEVLVSVEACGVGLTVINYINGDLKSGHAEVPRVPGHELVGRVIEQGKDVRTDLVDRRVTAYFYLICGECEPCRSEMEPLCERLAGLVGVHRDGGYAPLVALPARNVVAIPDSLDPVAATVIPDAVATPVHVTHRAGIGEDDRVVVIGAAGGVGIHMIQVAATAGATVAGLDVAAKLPAVEQRGARAADSTDFRPVDPDALFDDGRPTVVVDLLGTTASTTWGLEALGRRGRLVALTTFLERPLAFESRRLVFGEISVIGSRYASRAQIGEAAELVASGAVEPVIGRITGHEDVLQIHAELRSGSLVGRGALDWSL